MKLLTSTCGRAWFFNASLSKGTLKVGLACFLPGCQSVLQVENRGKIWRVEVPKRAINSVVPVKVSNARLSMLLEGTHE